MHQLISLFFLFSVTSLYADTQKDMEYKACVKEAPKYLGEVLRNPKPRRDINLNPRFACREVDPIKHIDPLQCLNAWTTEFAKPEYSVINSLVKRKMASQVCRASRTPFVYTANSDTDPNWYAWAQKCSAAFPEWMKENEPELRGRPFFDSMMGMLAYEVCNRATSDMPMTCMNKLIETFGPIGPKIPLTYVIRICRAPNTESNLNCFLSAIKELPEKDNLENEKLVNAMMLCEEGAGLIPLECYKIATEKYKIHQSHAIQHLCAGAKTLDAIIWK